MKRERALKIVLVVAGLLFCGGVYPMVAFFSREPTVPMLMSIYITLGIFLLLAVRDPAANRSLIAFGGWANLAHAGVMAAQEYRNVIERENSREWFCLQSSVLCWSRWPPRSAQARKPLLRSRRVGGLEGCSHRRIMAGE